MTEVIWFFSGGVVMLVLMSIFNDMDNKKATRKSKALQQSIQLDIQERDVKRLKSEFASLQRQINIILNHLQR